MQARTRILRLRKPKSCNAKFKGIFLDINDKIKLPKISPFAQNNIFYTKNRTLLGISL